MTDKKTYEQARIAGQCARAAGRPRDSGPRYALGVEGAMLSEVWREGWDSKDVEIKGSRK